MIDSFPSLLFSSRLEYSAIWFLNSGGASRGDQPVGLSLVGRHLSGDQNVGAFIRLIGILSSIRRSRPIDPQVASPIVITSDELAAEIAEMGLVVEPIVLRALPSVLEKEPVGWGDFRAEAGKWTMITTSRLSGFEGIKTIGQYVEGLIRLSNQFPDIRLPPQNPPPQRYPDDLWVPSRLLEYIGSSLDAARRTDNPTDWGKVTRDAALFLENELRERCSFDVQATGRQDLAAKALAPRTGRLLMDKDDALQKSWMHFVQGILGAFGNPTAHTIRRHSRSFAMGVVGAVSVALVTFDDELGAITTLNMEAATDE